MARVTTFACCGWAELVGVQCYRNDQFTNLVGAARAYSKGAFVFSSACVSPSPRSCGAARFAKDVEKAGLGQVTPLPPFKNPNSRRFIIPFLWTVNRDAVVAYCRDNNVKEFDPYRGW
jgi:hypothetical protein